ncbi:hypothetical protein [Virgibacillus kimchii]
MRNSNYQSILNRLTENASNKYPVSIPCLLFKDIDHHSVDLQNNFPIIDKDVLGQIMYELLRSTALDSCIPIIISLGDNTINRMESKGVYVLDSVNNRFIYLFGAEDHINFFNKIDKARNEAKVSTTLIIGYLHHSENHIMDRKHADTLNHLLDLHGDIHGKYTLLDYTEEINFPLLNENFKLSLLSWVIRDAGVKL